MKVETIAQPLKRSREDFESLSQDSLERIFFINDFVSQQISGYSFSLEGYNFPSLKNFSNFKTLDGLDKTIEHLKTELKEHTDLNELNAIQKAGIQLGLSFNEVSTNFGRPHLELALKGLDYSKYSDLTKDQAQALLDNPNLTKKDVIGLDDFQIKAIHTFDLSNDKVKNDWFKKEHLQALQAGREYFQIERLSPNQALVMALKIDFSRKFVSSLSNEKIQIIIELEQERLRPNITF